jgi:hypothetical protein
VSWGRLWVPERKGIATTSPTPYVTHDSAPPPTMTIPTIASTSGEALIDRVDEFIEVFFTLVNLPLLPIW